MPILYLVRHAEPVLRGVLLGQCDASLSPAGRAQAAAIRLPSVRVLYCSPLRRAQETIEQMRLNTEIRTLPELAEISYGEWDGRTWSEIEERWPALASAKLLDWRSVTPPGGEPWDQFAERVRRALDAMLAGSLPAATITHVAVNALLAARLRGDDPFTFTQAHGEVLACEF